MNLIILLLIFSLFAESKCNDDPKNTTEYPRTSEIIGGEPASIKDFPFVVSLIYRFYGGENGHVCGGFLVTPSWITTAAHCLVKHKRSSEVLPVTHFFLLASTADLVRRDSNYQKRSIKSFIPHPYFSWDLLYNDIGLIQASKPFEYNDHISLAALPRADQNFKFDSWIDCSVAGWGLTIQDNPLSASDKLLSVTLKVAPEEVCENEIGKTLTINPAGSICTYSENGTKDICKGDSGSALSCSLPWVKGDVLLPELASDWAEEGWNSEKWTHGIVVGIVSWSLECAKAGVPSVYTDIRHYRDWMRCTVISHGTPSKRAPVILITFTTTIYFFVLALPLAAH